MATNTPASKRRPTSSLLTTAILLGVAVGASACGPDDAGSTGDSDADAAGAPVPEATVPPVDREPMTEVDRMGLEPMTLFMELPWTANRANRGPAPAAARSTLLELETMEADPFDRVVFHFSEDAAFPGYSAQIVDGSTVSCTGPDEDREVTVDGGERLLAVRIAPAEARDVAVRQNSFGQARFQRGGLVCAESRELVWAASLAEGSEIRLMELRDPFRLVVDVR